MEKINYLEKELERLLTWIQAADNRLALILPLSTAMLGALAVMVPKFENWSILSAILSSFSVFFLILSLIFSACSSFPRTTGTKGSLIFFSGINSLDVTQFCKSVINLDEEKYKEDLINQCHINAKIAENKFKWIQRAMICLFISSLPWASSIFILYSERQ
ncbi:MAG: hypothetical protein ISS16_07380 [Ignavibacteria bacterium]|nr:hypothetical protein [Ignavibacteria bacterium]